MAVVPQGVHLFVRHSDALALADDRQTDLVHLCKKLLLREGVFVPGTLSSLSMVPPVCPSPRPDILAIFSPQAATMGAMTSVVLSPTPPVECLSHFDARNGRKRGGFRLRSWRLVVR